ncbi:7TM chemoreceptor [Ostertagia ostertagi]
MSYVNLITFIFHTIWDSIGMISNMVLFYLVLHRTPSCFKVYAILIANAAVTDLIIPIKTSLMYFSHGPCQMIGAEFCYIMYCSVIFCYQHSLYSMLFSFFYRYYILKKQQLSTRSLKLLLAAISTPSLFQYVSKQKTTNTAFATNTAKQHCLCGLLLIFSFHLVLQIILWFANDSATQLTPILVRELPHYDITNETISGHLNVFEWKTFTGILHMTLPITPVYISILILRRRTVAALSRCMMSDNTKKLHKQLLQALTYQAMLPGAFFIGVVCYTCGQIGLYHHPFLESLTLIALGIFPVLSPLISLYFIGPYKRIISDFLQRKVRRMKSSVGEATPKYKVTTLAQTL